ncbi:hypothetical protein ACFE04_015532 [Oxalis oulophora]
MAYESSNWSLLLALPDDVLVTISRLLSPPQLCTLTMCCKFLHHILNSDKFWFPQCQLQLGGIVSSQDLIEWGEAVSGYKALCRFLFNVKPLLGIWVHQNPELGNVVYVMFGFLSVVGCRIIPQELGPLGIEDGPIMWAPVFEIVGNYDGSAIFFLHGRDKGNNFIYPGSVKSVERNCNVLLLEVAPSYQKSKSKLTHSKTFSHHSCKEVSSNVLILNDGLSKSQRVLTPMMEPVVPFSRLNFSDRRKLLELVADQVRCQLPGSASDPFFPRLSEDCGNLDRRRDLVLSSERRSILLRIHKFGKDWKSGSEMQCDDSTQLDLCEIRKRLDTSSYRNSVNGNEFQAQNVKKKTIGRYFRDSFQHILGRNVNNTKSKNRSTSSENKHAQFHEFLKSGETIGLALHASTVKLSSYRAWPNMHDSKFALYKLPMHLPRENQEYAGLWGGTFGWPPGRPTEDKPGKALFFLLLSYEETQGQRLLIATKILEGTHYVLHPNGSAMFTVNINESSPDSFPWDLDSDSIPVCIEHAFTGEGIAHGYGFRYPGSKPGSLFVIQNGLLAFVWKESNAVLTLQRLNLQELLRKGDRVNPISPISNFSYLTKSYSNVFAGFPAYLTSPTRFVCLNL